MAEKKKVFELSDLLKILGVLALFIPLMTAAVQYRQTVKQDLDKNFRGIVEMLSSQDREKRLAAATNMGTFIEKGFYFLKDKYHNDAVDILINRTSVELDYNVLNAIMGSLKKAEKKDYNKIIEKLFAIERNFFIQEYPIEERKKVFDNTLAQIENEYIGRDARYKEKKLELDRLYLDNLQPELKQRQDDYFKTQRYSKELRMRKLVISDFLSVFIGGRDSSEQLKLFRNSLNNVVLADLDLRNSIFKMSAVGSSTISETKFDKSEIIDTVFTFSDLTKSSFRDCTISASLFDQITSFKKVSFFGSTFKDVFFAGSDMTEADFSGGKDLKPEYFYATKNINKAVFNDEKSKKEMVEKVEKVKEEDFMGFINRSELTEQRKDGLFSTLCELKYTLEKYPKGKESKRTTDINKCKEDFKKKAQEINK